MDPRVAKEVSISNLFDQFIEAATMRNVLSIHHRILNYADLNPCEFNVFFPRYKRAVTSNKHRKNWKAKALFSKIDKRAAHKCYSNTKSQNSLGAKMYDNLTNTSHDGTDERINSNYSNNNAIQSYNCLVIGSGPAGLRTAIELQLLGANKVCVVEKRSRFSRNNVLHLWPFVIDDLKSLGAKKFYGKFCAGSIDHISIRQLQLILLKVCLMVGCDFRDSCSYVSLCPDSIKLTTKLATNETSSDNLNDTICDSKISCNLFDETPGSKKSEFLSVSANLQKTVTIESAPNLANKANEEPIEEVQHCSGQNSSSLIENSSTHFVQSTAIELSPKRPDNLRGTHAHFESEFKMQEIELHSYEWDIIIGADGRRNTLSKFFPRKEFRGRLAIAITANFINRQTQPETSVPEISGLSFIYNQDMFNTLAYDTNIQLENICYYKDDTHYFVMTAKKRSLLERGVLICDRATTQDLLSDNNVNKEALLKYAKDAAFWTTGLEPLDFALNHYGQEDCAMFDFTSMYAASNACKALRTKSGGLTLVGLVGDSLLEPFWPTGSGCARGFLSSFDAAWMCRQWAVNKCAVINYHGSNAVRSLKKEAGDRSLNVSTGDDGPKMVISPNTYDRMALSVMAERESIYRILAQTTSENLQQNYSHWTLNPHTRYPNLNRHLVLPSQVEHLLSDAQLRINFIENSDHISKIDFNSNSRRVKSPNLSKSRKSPKKLKSAESSPLALPKNIKNRSKSLSKYCASTRSRQGLDLVDSFIEFEESYRNLADSDNDGMTQYLNYRHRNSTLDDLFVPSLSGTLPSSNNLSHLEAKRARDIDDCLRQRRQKSKINLVRDELITQLRGSGAKSPILCGGNAVLYNEIKRLREQQPTAATRGDSKPRDINGPLSLLNSMRRCASFAERVKSFENKLVQTTSQDNQSVESNISTPKTPIDNVRNLPQFATLQELIINNTTLKDGDARKSRIPVTKLTKGDWNVRCWENRLVRTANGGENGSGRSFLSKSNSADGNRFSNKPKKQVEVFQDRIKEMANKLKTSKELNQKLYQPAEKVKSETNSSAHQEESAGNSRTVRSQGWINHLKRELVKGSSESYNKPGFQQPMNPVLPYKPIKKLFQDDEDDGIDVNKHYDHLCINRPTNKYLTKGAYTSHLARAKLNSTSKSGIINAKVISRPNPTAESKQAYMAALTSRGSSASSTLSDSSSNTGNSSPGSAGMQQQRQLSANLPSSVIDVNCARCQKFVSTSDRITIGQSTMHRICLTCANCRLTLRSNEIQHYLNQRSSNDSTEQPSFLCTICKPEMRAELNCEADNRLTELNEQRALSRANEMQGKSKLPQSNRMQSREEFLNSRINYNELYKNILPASNSSSKELSKDENRDAKVSPSPIQVTLPLRLVCNNQSNNLSATPPKAASANIVESARKQPPSYKVANRETVNGSELITLILPLSTTPGGEPDTRLSHDDGDDDNDDDDQHPIFERDLEEGFVGEQEFSYSKRVAEQQHDLIDEEELHRILHLDGGGAQKRDSQASRKSSDASSTVDLSSSDIEDGDEIIGGERDSNSTSSIVDFETNCIKNSDLLEERAEAPSSDDASSSLELSPGSLDDFDDDDENNSENIDPNLAYSRIGNKFGATPNLIDKAHGSRKQQLTGSPSAATEDQVSAQHHSGSQLLSQT